MAEIRHEAAAVSVAEEEYRFKFLWRGRLFLAYNKGHRRYGDFYRSKPDFHPVLSPSGRELTTTWAHRYNHHHSIWIGHAKVNGVNVFHDNNPERPNLGDIVLEQAQVDEVAVPDLERGGGAPAGVRGARLRTVNGWVAKDGRRLCTERREIVVVAGAFGGVAHVIDLLSELQATEGPVELGQDTHSYLGVRVADSMDEEDGGRLRNSEGQEGAESCMGREAAWCDYSGQVAGQAVGITIVNHPQNPPTPFFTRAYGTMLANPTLHRSLLIPAGERLTLRWRLLFHEGDTTPLAP
jgi:hypothetical protein